MERWSFTGGAAIHLEQFLSLTQAIATQGGSVGLERGQHCGDRAPPILLDANNLSIVHLKLQTEGFFKFEYLFCLFDASAASNFVCFHYIWPSFVSSIHCTALPKQVGEPGWCK